MINVTSCQRMLPDPASHRDCLPESFEELRDACGVSR
jgi:hypothetical protein